MDDLYCNICEKPLVNGFCSCMLRKPPPKKKPVWIIFLIVGIVAVLLVAVLALGLIAALGLGGGAVFLFNRTTKPDQMQVIATDGVNPPVDEMPEVTVEVPMFRPTEAPETEPPVEPVYLIYLPVVTKFGKLWTMSENPYFGYAHTDVSDGDAYLDTVTPGHTTGPVYDYLGNRYTCGLFVDGDTLESYYVSYALGGQYEIFTGKISCSSDLSGTDSIRTFYKYVEIYADGELIYTSAAMTQGVGPQAFRLDVRNVQTLTILYPKSKGQSRLATVYDGLLE